MFNINIMDQPNGGFLPIYICNREAKKEENEEEISEKKIREYKTQKQLISIKKLLEIRKKKTPFIKA